MAAVDKILSQRGIVGSKFAFGRFGMKVALSVMAHVEKKSGAPLNADIS